jgi:hypothetical protein
MVLTRSQPLKGVNMMRKPDGLLILALTSIVMVLVIQPYPEGGGKLIERGRGSTGMCYNVIVEGQTAYVVNNQGLVILDVSDPDRPKKIGAVKGLSPSFAVDLSRHFAYVGGEGGLAVIDVADPKHPRVIGQFLKGETINVLNVAGDIAFVINSESSLKILSIINRELPQQIGEFNDGGHYYYHALGRRDDILYLADLEQGLELIDVSDPRSPRKILTVPGTEGSNSVFVDRDLLVLDFPKKGPAMYSISDPRVPLRCANVFDEDETLRVKGLSSDYLVVKPDDERVAVFKISSPLNPNLIASRSLARTTAVHGTFIGDNFIYFTGKGMSVFEIRE